METDRIATWVEHGEGSTIDGDDVDLAETIPVLIGNIDHGGAVRADSGSAHTLKSADRAVELGGRTAGNGNAVKLDDTIGVLIGAVDHGGAVWADLG